jgi:hypothetical protein
VVLGDHDVSQEGETEAVSFAAKEVRTHPGQKKLDHRPERFIPCCSGCLPYEAPRLRSTSDHQGRRGNLLGAALTFIVIFIGFYVRQSPAAKHNVPKIFMPFSKSPLSRERDFMFLKNTKGFFNYTVSCSYMFSRISINILISMN